MAENAWAMPPDDQASGASDVGAIGAGGTAVVLSAMFGTTLVPVAVAVVAGLSWGFQTIGVFDPTSLVGPTVLTALLWVPGAAIVYSFGGTVLGKVIREDTDTDDVDDVPEDTGDDPAETIAAIRDAAGSDGAPPRPRADTLRALLPGIVLLAPATIVGVTGGSVAWYWWVLAGLGSLGTAIAATGMGPFVGGTGGPWPPGWVVATNYVIGLPLALLSTGWAAQALGWVTVPATVTVFGPSVTVSPVVAIAPPVVFAIVYPILTGGRP